MPLACRCTRGKTEMDTMRGVCLTKDGRLSLEEFPVPPMAADMVRIRIGFAGDFRS